MISPKYFFFNPFFVRTNKKKKKFILENPMKILVPTKIKKKIIIIIFLKENAMPFLRKE
jgi:hypothetical protein